MIELPIPQNQDPDLITFLREFLRRSIDWALNPVQVGTDIKITSASNGIIFTAASGNTWRLNIVEVTGEDGSTNAVTQLTRVS